MLKKILIASLFLTFIISWPNQLQAAVDYNHTDKIEVVYFYQATCPHCQLVKPFLEGIKKDYKDDIEVYEIMVDESDETVELFYTFLNEYNIPYGEGGVPAIFIGSTHKIGDTPIINNLEHEINNCKLSGCELKVNLAECLNHDHEECEQTERQALTLPIILGAAIVDSINPCALGVLFFLIAFIFSIKASRKKLLSVGLTYILVIFIVYYLAGLGLLKFVSHFQVAHTVNIIAGIVIIIAGLVSLKEVFWPKDSSSLGISDRVKPTIEKYLHLATVPSVIAAGILVALFELPCTGEVYLAILSLLSKEDLGAQGYWYLFVYNLIFVLPLLIILLLSAFGLNVQRVSEWHSSRKRLVKFIMGLVMIALGLYLLLV